MSITLSKKLGICQAKNSDLGECLLHYCPGCDQLHCINIEKPNHMGVKWSWDGNAEKPTFTPSVNILGLCHYNITHGKIFFHGDSVHNLAGKSIDLPDIPSGFLCPNDCDLHH